MGVCVFKVGFLLIVLVPVFGGNYDAVADAMSLLPDCSGVTEPVSIKPESLKGVFISILDPDVSRATWTQYDYYHAADIANHPGFDLEKKTFMFVPGYVEFLAAPLGRSMAEVYKKLGYNVFLLETKEFTAMSYPTAARYTRRIGLHVAEMLANLTCAGLDPQKLELVGLSLGAHTMSFIAKSYRQITGRNISSLVGLDPAGPCFRHLGPDHRLDSSDAHFVLSIATDIYGLGMSTNVGHVTFYVNGGEHQPRETWWLPCTLECSHVRSFFLWLSALNNPHSFIGIQCDTIQQARNNDCYDRTPTVTNTMDLYTDRSKPGIYYLATYNRYPYFLGQRGIERTQKSVSTQTGMNNVKSYVESATKFYNMVRFLLQFK